MIKEGAIEERAYQINIARVAREGSTLAVLPTGMGKTIIAFLVMAHVKEREPDGKILFMAPTKPLVDQHARDIESSLKLGKPAIFTGEVKPKDREKLWQESSVIVSTPQVIRNDLMAESISLDDVSLVVFDEAHRGVGSYAYVFIGEKYAEIDGLALGLTASPGSKVDQILSVCENLGLENVEIRTKDDGDVVDYVKKREYRWVNVSLPTTQRKIVNRLKDLRNSYVVELQRYGVLKGRNPGYVSKKALLDANRIIRAQLNSGGKRSLYNAASIVASALKLDHAIDLAETQGPESLEEFIEKMESQATGRGGTKAAKRLVESVELAEVKALLKKSEPDHPKIGKAVEVVREQMDIDGDSRVIAFTSYRHTAKKLKERLEEVEGVRPVRFVGQANKDGDKGLKQKEQIKAIEDFESGVYNVLVATSVGEEGLDIPATDLVVFFEPVASEIRTIQRRGRTARKRKGKVTVLITKNTRDEAYYWTSKSKEKNMGKILNKLKREIQDRNIGRKGEEKSGRYGVVTKKSKKELVKGKEEEESTEKGQRSIFDFKGEDGDKKKSITVDSREQNSRVVRELYKKGLSIKTARLGTGDYLISEDMAVERKSVDDFLESLMDGRLFTQARALVREFQRPVIIIEGDGIYSRRNIDRRAIHGALVSLITDFRIPILQTSDEEETAALIHSMHSRSDRQKKTISLRKDKESLSSRDAKIFILEGLPNVSGLMASRLLEHFGSVGAVFQATEEELMEVKGIGEVTARKIVELIR